MKKIKTVIFDFDGVIADSLPYHFKQMVEIARKNFGVKGNEKKIIDEIRTKSYFELMKTFKISWTKAPLILKIIHQARENLFNNIEKIKIFPGTKKLLINLTKRKLILIILSSNLEKTINKFIELNKIDYFNQIVCGTNILGKAVEIESLLRRNNWKKEEAVYIGDEIRDVEACKKIGMKIIGVSWGFQKAEVLKKHGADYIAKKPNDILKIIQPLQRLRAP